jgi:hypothetical protein
MERIGIAASKMAKDNLALYNFYVALITFLLAAVLFLIAGGAVFLALVGIGFLYQGIIPGEPKSQWWALVEICMAVLSIAVGIITLFAIMKNLKFRR